jgi:HD-GYP domain-containing protein (c-di-GMP phosphodiesterase class II)
MDVYDELKTRRSYKKAVGVFDTLIIMKKTNEQRIWPKLLNSFISLMDPDL